MADRLGIGALDGALGAGYGFEHDTVLGEMVVTRPDGVVVRFSDSLALAEALERIVVKSASKRVRRGKG